MNELFAAGKEGRDPKFLIHAAADVVATARECFDYLGQDIVESYLLPSTKQAKIKKQHALGQLRVYFPFHEPQVKSSKQPLHEIKVIHRPLYDDLVHFVEAVAAKRRIENTSFNYGTFIELKDMVNEKKHDRLLAIKSEAEQEYLIQNENMSIVFPKKQQIDVRGFIVAHDTIVTTAAEYRFAHNNAVVSEFCLFAVKATELVMKQFYTTHFQS